MVEILEWHFRYVLIAKRKDIHVHKVLGLNCNTGLFSVKQLGVTT